MRAGSGALGLGKACLALSPLQQVQRTFNLFPRGSFADKDLLLLTSRQLSGECPWLGAGRKSRGCSEQDYKGLSAQQLRSLREIVIVLYPSLCASLICSSL